MKLRDYIRLFTRRWKLILGTLVVTVVAAVLLTAQIAPQYASSARLFISTAPGDSSAAFQGTAFTEQRVSSYADVINGLELAQRVVNSLDLDISAETLATKVTAEVVPSTVVLRVTVTDGDPRTAQRINEGFVRQLGLLVRELETPPGGRNALLKATVVDAPNLPDAPFSPQPSRNYTFAVILGLLLGFGLAIARELLDRTIKDVESVPALASTPALSSLAFDRDVKKHPLITSLESHAPRVEAFRVLRTNLSFIHVDQPHKALVFTSAVPGEGKSTTAVNAAIAMAGAGQRVLLVDGDLRRPQVHNLLQLEGTVGLTTVLAGRCTFDEALQLHAASGLDVLTSGVLPPNPAELLQSRAMKELLEHNRQRYDVIVFDAPPLLPVTDSALLASETDGAVLVVRHGSTTKDEVSDAVERLRSVDSTPLGVVLNMVPVGRSGRYGYGYGYSPTQGPVVASSPPVRTPVTR